MGKEKEDFDEELDLDVDANVVDDDLDLDDEGRAYWMGDFRGQGSGREDLTYGQDERPVQTREQVLANIRRSEEYKLKQSGE